MEPHEAAKPSVAPNELWLGYDGLIVAFDEISALLVYQPVWERRMRTSYGRVPPDVRAIVLLQDGRVLPARRALDDLQLRWTQWQQRDDAMPPPSLLDDEDERHAAHET